MAAAGGAAAAYLERAEQSRAAWRARTPLLLLALGAVLFVGAFALAPFRESDWDHGVKVIRFEASYLWFLGGFGAGFLAVGAALRLSWGRKAVAAAGHVAGKIAAPGSGGWLARRAGRKFIFLLFGLPLYPLKFLPWPWEERAVALYVGALFAGAFGFTIALFLDPDFRALYFRPRMKRAPAPRSAAGARKPPRRARPAPADEGDAIAVEAERES